MRPQAPGAQGTIRLEPAYGRALAIWEEAPGPEHPDVATALENYSAFLRETERAGEATGMEARAKAIRAKHAAENPQRLGDCGLLMAISGRNRRQELTTAYGREADIRLPPLDLDP